VWRLGAPEIWCESHYLAGDERDIYPGVYALEWAAQKLSSVNINIQREEKTDARRLLLWIVKGRRRIDRLRIVNRPRHIDRLGVIMALLISAPVAIIMRFTVVPTVVSVFIVPIVVFCERRPHGYTAYHRGEDKRDRCLANCRP
jgi:hypothetical protein